MPLYKQHHLQNSSEGRMVIQRLWTYGYYHHITQLKCCISQYEACLSKSTDSVTRNTTFV